MANWIVAFTTPILLARSSFGAYFFFGFSTLVCLVVCVFAMPETKGKALEEIDQAFQSRTRSFSLGMFTSRTRRRPGIAHHDSRASDIRLVNMNRPQVLSQ